LQRCRAASEDCNESTEAVSSTARGCYFLDKPELATKTGSVSHSLSFAFSNQPRSRPKALTPRLVWDGTHHLMQLELQVLVVIVRTTAGCISSTKSITYSTNEPGLERWGFQQIAEIDI
jgi:hypothetical protein